MSDGFLQRARGAGTGDGRVIEAFTFAGPEGPLEGLWKPAEGAVVGSAVFAHPHPKHGGTLHNKVVFRAAKALTRGGYGTLRFNFRGVGLSAGRYDEGRGEVADFHAAEAEAERRGGLPQIAGGFSFGSAVALRAISEGPARAVGYIGVGLPLSAESGRGLCPPSIPALFVVGEHDAFGPPEAVKQFVGDAGRVVVVPGGDHFLAGALDVLEVAIRDFLAGLPARRHD